MTHQEAWRTKPGHYGHLMYNSSWELISRDPGSQYVIRKLTKKKSYETLPDRCGGSSVKHSSSMALCPLHNEPTACQALPLAPSGRIELLPIGSTGSEEIRLDCNIECFEQSYVPDEHVQWTRWAYETLCLACENQYISTGQQRMQVGLCVRKLKTNDFCRVCLSTWWRILHQRPSRYMKANPFFQRRQRSPESTCKNKWNKLSGRKTRGNLADTLCAMLVKYSSRPPFPPTFYCSFNSNKYISG